MAFAIQKFDRISYSNAGDFTINYATGAGTNEGCPSMFSYTSSTDALATIVAANYFLSVVNDLQLYDLILCVDNTGVSELVQVTTIVYPNDVQGTYVPTVVVSAFAAAGTIGTGNINNLAVTAAKIANNTITATQIANGTITTTQLAPTTIQYATGTITAAQFNGAYGAPFLLLAAQGANTLIDVSSLTLELVYGAAQFTAGGVLAAQYDSTVHGAGTLATGTIAAATINGAAASSSFKLGGALALSANTTVVNKGIYLSNLTQAFATGDSTFNFYLAYRVYTTT